jgi:O-antigen/teichoic acid export membrane protein
VAREYSASPKFLLPAAALDVATSIMPVFLIAALFNVEAAGQYSLAWRMVALPLTLCGMAMGQVFFRRFAQAVAEGRGAKKLLYHTWAALFLVGVIPALLIMAAGPSIFSVLFGARWSPAGAMASALAPMLLAILISSPTSTTFVVLGLQRLNLVFGAATLAYRPALLLVGWMLNDLVLAFVLWSAVEVIQIVIYNWIAIKTLDVRLARPSTQ